MEMLFWLLLEGLRNLCDPLFFLLFAHSQVDAPPRHDLKGVLFVLCAASWQALAQALQFGYSLTLSAYLLMLLTYVRSLNSATHYQRFIIPCIGSILPLVLNLSLTVLITFYPGLLLSFAQQTPLRGMLLLLYLLFASIAYSTARRLPLHSDTFSERMQFQGTVLFVIVTLFCAYLQDLTPSASAYAEAAYPLMLACWWQVIMLIMFLFFYQNALRERDLAAWYQAETMDIRNEQRALRDAVLLDETIRSLHHDLKNQHISLRLYAEQQDYAGLLAYLDQLNREFAPAENMLFSGYPALDAVISSKMMQAELQRVHSKIRFAAPDRLPLSEAEICSLMGNLLDNALEATALLPEIERQLHLEAHTDAGIWQITLWNSFNGIYRLKNNEFQSLKSEPGHGYGLKRVRQLVQKSLGQVEFLPEERRFTVSLHLPLPDERAVK